MTHYPIRFFSVLFLCSVLCCTTLFAEENNGQQADSSIDQEYQLGSGDLLKITVFNQEDLSGEYTINGAGQISLPLIGTINAKNLTAKQVEQGIVNK